MIRFEALQHVAVVVTDLPRAIRFYASSLGLAQLDRPNFDFPGAWFAIGNQQLHLLTNEHAKTLRETTAVDTRDGHFAIRVASFQETIRHLEQSGIPYRANENSVTGWKQIFIVDPDGNVIEFNAQA